VTTRSDNAMNTVTENPNTAARWPLERILFAMAGTAVLLGALLAAVASPWFLLLVAFAGVNQWLFVLLGKCPASLVLERLGVEARHTC
jgi:hypothetical protein